MTAGGRVAIALRDAEEPAANGRPDARAADGMIGFEGGGRRLTTRLLGGEFIKYASRFPAEFGSWGEIAPGPLIEAVRRVSLVAERGSPVRLAFGDDEVVIEAGSQGQARAVERVPAAFAGDERVIAFSPHYLLDGLTAAATPAAGQGPAKAGGAAEDAGAASRGGAPGRIRLEFTSAVRPAVITSVAAEDDDTEGQAGPAAEPSAHGERGTPDFRYLVVPLRMPGST
jgi:DNA polymerase III sliding clamp (beta) subunit (PCNA family)